MTKVTGQDQNQLHSYNNLDQLGGGGRIGLSRAKKSCNHHKHCLDIPTRRKFWENVSIWETVCPQGSRFRIGALDWFLPKNLSQ